MEPPNRVPPGRLSLRFDPTHFFLPLGCRHGLALIFHQTRKQFLVWDPVTGYKHWLAFPPGFDPFTHWLNGAVLRAAAGDDDHFQVVIVDTAQPGQRALAWVYSSETGLWGHLISTPIPLQPSHAVSNYLRDPIAPSVLVGNCLYWQLPGCSSSILEFDLEKEILDVIQVPVDLSPLNSCFTIIRADGGALGFLFVSDFTAQLWERNADCNGLASWVLGRTIQLDKLLSLLDSNRIMMLVFAEENNMLFLWTRGSGSPFAVQLRSLQFKKLSEFSIAAYYFPFGSVYTTETNIGGGHDGAELLHNT